MITSTNIVTLQVQAKSVRFEGDIIHVLLSDGRDISVSLHQFDWLKWLANAPQEKREKWSIEPNGYAIYWDDLDDGIEVEHLLSMQPLN